LYEERSIKFWDNLNPDRDSGSFNLRWPLSITALH